MLKHHGPLSNLCNHLFSCHKNSLGFRRLRRDIFTHNNNQVSTRLASTRSSQQVSREELEEIMSSPSASSSILYSRETPARTMFSVRKQLAAEAEWLQDDSEEGGRISGVHYDALGNPTRFDWRNRASSQVRRRQGKDVQPAPFVPRIRAAGPTPSESDPYCEAISAYSKKFKRLIDLEESEDEAALRERLAQWSLERLQHEGYTVLGMRACWLEANQFGRPVAAFSLEPGIKLPDHKFEGGMQVLLSRGDPLKENVLRGSILSHVDTHIRVSFSERFQEVDEGLWRLDLGRPNLVYERTRSAISSLNYDPVTLEKDSAGSSPQFILEGTHLRDVLLRGFASPEDECTREERRDLHETRFEDMGAFKDDMRIVSWTRRYSRKNPLVVEGDPPLDHLNHSQKQALAAMIGQKISLIQGPPGTGKTKTIIEAIKLLKLHFEVPQPLLVCTYTNMAVDNLVEGLGKAGVNPLRVGFNGNVRQSLVEYSLDFKLQKHPLHPVLLNVTADENKVSKQRQDLESRYKELSMKLGEQKRPKKSLIQRAIKMKGALDAMELRCRSLKRKIYATQQQMLRDVIADADVVCTTCVTAACAALNVVDFPVVFLDEASMSTEPASLIPIMKGSQHVALIGDHKQLPPVIVSKKAQADGLAMSLFERLTEEGVVPSIMLDMQYRMHPDISHFPSSEFYNLSLMNGTVDKDGCVIPGLHPPQSKYLERHFQTGTMPSVVFLDHTRNESMKGRSYLNVAEAHIVASIVEDLLLHNEHLRGQDIGIISPYVGQIGFLTRLLRKDLRSQARFKELLGDGRAMEVENIEIKTVDGFEGREKEVIIFSTVRNNSKGNIGFLADRRRLNVGLTRAKRGLFVIGSIQTLEACKKTAVSGVNAPTTTVDRQPNKDAEVWSRYAEFLKAKKLVVSLTGTDLSKYGQGVYGEHLETQQRISLEEEATRMILGHR